MNNFYTSLKNAFGSIKDFEETLIKAAFISKSKNIYLVLDYYNNFKIISNDDNLLINNDLLKIDLNNTDLFNFIDDIDYEKLKCSYELLYNS